MNAHSTPVAAAEAALGDLEERILDAMQTADSKAPARADAIVAKVGGEPAAVWDAIACLIAQRRVGQCLITKAGQPSYHAVWPTGVAPRTAQWSGNSHSSLYAKSAQPVRLPAAPDPERDPRPDLGYATHREKAEFAARQAHAKGNAMPDTTPKRSVKDVVAEVLDDIPASAAITFSDLMNRAVVAAGREISSKTISWALAALADEGAIAITPLPSPHPRGPRNINGYYDPEAAEVANPEHRPAVAAAKPQQAEAPSERVAKAAPAPADYVAFAAAARTAIYGEGAQLTSAEQFVIFEPDNAADARFHFALFCSGELGITVGDRYLLLPPTAARRLAALLGVPAGGAAA